MASLLAQYSQLPAQQQQCIRFMLVWLYRQPLGEHISSRIAEQVNDFSRDLMIEGELEHFIETGEDTYACWPQIEKALNTLPELKDFPDLLGRFMQRHREMGEGNTDHLLQHERQVVATELTALMKVAFKEDYMAIMQEAQRRSVLSEARPRFREPGLA